MLRNCHSMVLLACLMVMAGVGEGTNRVHAEQTIGFIEKFATAQDRRLVLSELIPGTEDFFYFHTLHFQNENELASAQQMLESWRAKFGDTGKVSQMVARQQLLQYATNPQQTLEYLRKELGLNLDHAPPARDRAASLPDALDNAQLNFDRLLAQSLAQDRSLNQFETAALGLVLDHKLSVEQLRALLSRLDRGDHSGTVKRVAEELALTDSAGFGWAGVHALLSLEQLRELHQALPQLLENDNYVRAVTARLAPPEGSSLTDQTELRSYLERLKSWTESLPPAQNSFKALVLGNLLRLDLSESKFDRGLFIEYLKLPRSAAYYEPRKLINLNVGLVQLDFAMDPQVPLPAMGDDSELVRRYLEHFLQAEDSVNEFAAYLKRDYLERVLAQTKILFGIGDEATWYAKLNPTEQQELKERVEVRFAPHNPHHFDAQDEVALEVEVKNVDQLLVKIYEINLLNYYRSHTQAPGTDIDLDGLVPNQQRQLSFAQPAQRRHLERIEFAEFTGRGTWVVDLLGGGQRSRAVIQKGRLTAFERMGDAGQVFEIVNESGEPVPTAHLELNGRKFEPETNGQIILPYAEKTVTRSLLLVDGDFVSPMTVAHYNENYQLQAGFLVDRQSLVAGTQANIAIRARLSCNGRPISVRLLEDAQLTIVATDADGIATTQSVESLDLDDGDELVHRFLVPPRLTSLNFTLSGRVANRSRDLRDEVSTGYSLQCNGIQQSPQIADFYLRETTTGYRLLVLGRNGEPLPRLPVSLALKLNQFTNHRNFALATNAKGEVMLGELSDVTQIELSAEGIQPTSFALSHFHRYWPNTIQVGRGETIELPLGKATADATQFSLAELRRNTVVQRKTQQISVGDGSLKISDLPTGDYILQDHEAGQRVKIVVGDERRRDNLIAAPHRLLQATAETTLIIRQAAIEDGNLLVRVAGADKLTRLHVVATQLKPEVSSSRQLQLPHPPLMSRGVPVTQSRYVDSLRLDEEYSYILNRQLAQKYPGNLLPQPTLLVHPWEVSVTENSEKQAAAGDAMPPSPAMAEPHSRMQAEAEASGDGARPDWKSYDFLAQGTVLLANLELTDGSATIPLEQLDGFNSLTIIAVHPTSSDSRSLTRESEELKVRDQRLRTAFDSTVHLAQVQKVEQLAAGEKKLLGDPRTRRLQAYTTIADVFQLYSTLLSSPDWEKFRFVGGWHQLSPEEQLARYNELACHELNFFLYHKDRPFFDRVVKPLLSHKLDKQLVDLWLLGEPLEDYLPLWRIGRLNTLERILLAANSESQRAGTERWLRETLEAHPLSPTLRQQRFEIALRGSALEANSSGGTLLGLNFDRRDAVMNFSQSMGGAMNAPLSSNGISELRRSRARAERPKLAQPSKDKAELGDEFFGVDRLGRGLMEERLFQSLDKTREWAETHYFHIRLANQSAALIPPGAFWQEYLNAGSRPFLPRNLDLPCGSLNEALCALAVIDLPLVRPKLALAVDDDQLTINCDAAAVVFLESIEPTTDAPAPRPTVLVGQDIYLASPSTDDESNLPVGDTALLSGIPYRTNVVVTNPTSRTQRVEVLTQLPAGSLPLAGSKLTRSTAIELQPYSTAQAEYAFYFPAAGQFAHYGAQVSTEGTHLAATDSSTHRVTDEPESVDETTWSYVADWGTHAQVLDYLSKANLERLDLARMAFRLQDKAFYTAVTELLASSGRFEASLWAYALRHDDRQAIAQLLHHRPDFTSRLGSVFNSPLIEINPREQMSYEHLDYKPLVVARTHQLGREAVILNPSLHQQYLSLLDVLSHERSVSNDQRLQLCYYMLLQNRIEEALQWFASVEQAQLATQMQYDYFDAYLDFYRGDYERAARIAGGYLEYPLPRWAEMFARIREQVATRQRLLQGEDPTSDDNSASPLETVSSEASQRLLADRRAAQQDSLATRVPALDVDSRDGSVSVRYRNLENVTVNYYLMDIELLFSRNPFVSQGTEQVPAIRPNFSEHVVLAGGEGVATLELPAQMQNRNLLMEVTAGGISRSVWLTASSLVVSVAEPMGRLQVLSREGRAPASAAYVKVFARHPGGSVRFFKDGYTDLNGNFDYATLSTSDLDTTERLAILILDEKFGAVVKEASPPTR